nr:hypothetical protein CFP56_28718 [Quercus suber]
MAVALQWNFCGALEGKETLRQGFGKPPRQLASFNRCSCSAAHVNPCPATSDPIENAYRWVFIIRVE